MKINSIELTDVGGIPHLNLEFLNTQMNIICGENGVGKTTLLDSIGHIFTNQYSHILKKNINSNRATINGNVTDDRE
jgi:predicted ATP-binding protein involved in virulence